MNQITFRKLSATIILSLVISGGTLFLAWIHPALAVIGALGIVGLVMSAKKKS